MPRNSAGLAWFHDFYRLSCVHIEPLVLVESVFYDSKIDTKVELEF